MSQTQGNKLLNQRKEYLSVLCLGEMGHAVAIVTAWQTQSRGPLLN